MTTSKGRIYRIVSTSWRVSALLLLLNMFFFLCFRKHGFHVSCFLFQLSFFLSTILIMKRNIEGPRFGMSNEN